MQLSRCTIQLVRLCIWTSVVLSTTHVFAQPGGGPGTPDIEIVKDFDADGDNRLNAEERKKALEWLATRPQTRRGGPGGRGGGRGGRGRGSRGRGGPPGGRGPGQNRPAGTVGPEVSFSDANTYKDASLYDTGVLRTIFLTFENDKWESELAAFKPTDVEVPATMKVDGETYANVGVSFRGASSFFMIPEGSKRSLNLSVDFVDEDQRLYGHKTLNLLNCNGDASLMSSFLYHDIASKKMATPKVNFVKVVINGRSWGVYASAQQFNKDFLKENYGSKKGARWKVEGSPRGDGGLRYLGEETAPYEERFKIKSKDDAKAWTDLINLCKVLNETPADELEAALEPILDIDGALWFLAVDVALINSDGYWTRASDYSIYQNKKGVFHILPHDMNEAFRESHGRGGPGGPGGPPGGLAEFFRGFGPPGPPPEGGPQDDQRRPGQFDGPPRGQRPERGAEGRGRGRDERGGPPEGRRDFGAPQGSGFEVDPLTGLDDDRFPLRSKLLAVPALKKRYLQHVKTIAEKYLDWKYLGPKVASARNLIQDEVKADTRKLMTYENFLAATNDEDGKLREFCEKRAEYLLSLPAIKELSE